MKGYLSLALRIVIAVIFVQTLYFKFTGHPDSVFIFSQLGVEPYGRIGLGIAELITSVLILWNSTKLIGIGLSFFIICGALFSHLLVIGTQIKGDSGGLFTLACIVFVGCLSLFYLHKTEIMKLLGR
jgi:hypothetical protein